MAEPQAKRHRVHVVLTSIPQAYARHSHEDSSSFPAGTIALRASVKSLEGARLDRLRAATIMHHAFCN
jgi:hypothetical protein